MERLVHEIAAFFLRMGRTMKFVLCVRAGPNDTSRITENNLYKAAA